MVGRDTPCQRRYMLTYIPTGMHAGQLSIPEHVYILSILIWISRNSVTTASQLRTNRFLDSSPHAFTVAYAVMNEVVAIAKAKGLTMPDDIVERHIHDCVTVEGGLPSSMLMDHMQQRPMEIEVRSIRVTVVVLLLNLSP